MEESLKKQLTRNLYKLNTNALIEAILDLKEELEKRLEFSKGDPGPKPVAGVDYTIPKDGYTPVKGVDYFDGENGYTPVKGKDYFDGAPGYTPVKGKDYFDGKPGKDAEPVNTATIAVEASKLTLEAVKPLLPTVKDIENNLPQLGEPIRDALELINEEDKKLKIDAIGYLREELDKLKKEFSRGVIVGGTTGLKEANMVDDEVVGGSDTSWTINYIPIAGSFKLYANGQRLRVTDDYTISGTTITTTQSWEAGTLLADYRR